MRSIDPRGFKFSDITSPDQFMVREHFEDFSHTHPGLTTRGTTMRAVNQLMDGNGDPNQLYIPDSTLPPRLQASRKPQPLAGISLATREELDIEDYYDTIYPGIGRFLMTYAVQAGSLVDFSKSLESLALLTPKCANTVAVLGHAIDMQFDSTTNS